MRLFKTLLTMAVLFLAVNALAATKMTLDHPAQINGTQLAAGEYTVQLDGDKLTFYKGKTEVATAKVKLQDNPTKSSYDAFVVSRQGDTAVIREITFKGKKQSAVISADPNSGAGN